MTSPKAIVHLVSLDKDDFELPTLEELEMHYPGISEHLKRGDIIENVKVSGYRSCGVSFYDGFQIIGQNMQGPDDYGTPPKEFHLITEFPPEYWDGKLPVNDAFVKAESKFYWHCDDGTFSPLGSEVVDIIQRKGKVKPIVFPANEYMKLETSFIKFDFGGKRIVLLINEDALQDSEIYLMSRSYPLDEARRILGDPLIDYILDINY
jgi:hypothetical protein